MPDPQPISKIDNLTESKSELTKCSFNIGVMKF